MKVKDIMTTSPRTCTADTNLAEAAALMLEADCGFLPVVDGEGRLTGVITDRDMYIALGTRNCRASEVTVGDVARLKPISCEPDDDVEHVLAVMREHRVRRLPVEGFGGIVAGIVSMNDIVPNAGRGKVPNADIIETLRSICSHHRPTPQIAAA